MLMDNNFMTQRKFVINKIKKVDDGWNLYPVDNPSLPIFWEEPSDEDLEDFMSIYTL